MNIYEFWAAVLRQEPDKIRPFFHPNAVIRWHNTNEQFTVDEYIRANCEYPGRWGGEVERVISTDTHIITATHVYSTDSIISCHATSFLRTENGKILSLDEYWGDDGPVPGWRQEMSFGTAIK